MSCQETLSRIDFTLKPLDKDLLKTFRTLCKVDGKTRFSSDDFRMYGLDRFLKDQQHGVGGLFARWKHHRLVAEVDSVRSRIPSNHLRRISLYEWTE